MKIVVTGGTGFLGSHIVQILNTRGYDEVRVLHRASSKLSALEGTSYQSVIGDLLDVESLKSAFAGCEVVFHVAAVADYWRADHEWMYKVNVEGTRTVLQAAREVGVRRVIFTSSAAAVGLQEDGSPSDESVAFNFRPEQFPYGHSKALAEEVVAEAVQAGQDVVICNPVIIIGHSDLNMISGSFIVQTKKLGRWLPYTSGGVSVVDVRDVARWHVEAIENGKTGERHILMTQNLSQQDWNTLIAEVIGVRPSMIYTPDWMLKPMAMIVRLASRLNFNFPVDADQVLLGSRNVHFDGSKVHGLLGSPQYDMRTSVKDTYDWFETNGYLK